MSRARRASLRITALLTTSLVGLSSALALAGCSGTTECDGCTAPTSGGTTSGGTTSGGSSSSSSSSSGGPSDLKWSTLITGNWELGAGAELTSDVHTLTLDHDVYVGAIRPISPPGTHHTVLGIGNFGTGNIVYASGVGTNPIVFPKGVGLKLEAGVTLVLQLHVFNVTSETITGLSGIEIVEVAPADVENEADLFLPGPLNFNIPANQKLTHAGNCTVDTPQQIFAIFPHMHQLGTHFKTTLTVGGQPMVLHDDSYDFEHQAFIPFDPIALNPGDTITTECTWQNTLPQSVGWGESSTTEMCFSILYRYPALDGNGFCQQ